MFRLQHSHEHTFCLNGELLSLSLGLQTLSPFPSRYTAVVLPKGIRGDLGRPKALDNGTGYLQGCGRNYRGRWCSDRKRRVSLIGGFEEAALYERISNRKRELPIIRYLLDNGSAKVCLPEIHFPCTTGHEEGPTYPVDALNAETYNTTTCCGFCGSRRFRDVLLLASESFVRRCYTLPLAITHSTNRQSYTYSYVAVISQC